MPGTKIGPRLGPNASERRNDAQIRRAAKRAGWAGEALESAADDLDGACGAEGNPLTGLQEAVQDEAKRVANLAEDIASHMGASRRGHREPHGRPHRPEATLNGTPTERTAAQ